MKMDVWHVIGVFHVIFRDFESSEAWDVNFEFIIRHVVQISSVYQLEIRWNDF